MFAANEKHRQKPLFSTISSLPEKQRQRLEASWAGTFYTEVFSRIEESIFAVLYSDNASRPNIPVNIMLGLEILKDGNGWTDEEMYSNFCYNVQVRYALGLHSLDEGHFELRTTYNFRQRLVGHMQETGENLVEECFEQITDEQMTAFEVKGQVQRVDSKQLTSNIRRTTRLQLLVEILQRTYRMLDAADKIRYQGLFAPYIKGKSGQYIYRLKGEKHQTHIEQVGVVMAQLLSELAANYASDPGYYLLKRVFDEHFKLEEESVSAKADTQLSASSLQSPDDLEATFRRKRNKGHVGYVVNVTETVDPEGLQLITKVQTEANVTDDAQMLNAALPDLVERSELETLYTDGGYGSPDVDATCRQQGVTQYQTAIRGASPDPETPTLSNFSFQLDEAGRPQHMHCPHGHPVDLSAGRKTDRFVARVAESVCAQCAAYDKRQASDKVTGLTLVLYFSLPELAIALRRQHMQTLRTSGRNPRAAVEATVREISCRFPNAKLRVRGHCRVSMTMIAAAAMCNARRIWRFAQLEASKQGHKNRSLLAGASTRALLQPWQRPLTYWLALFVNRVMDANRRFLSPIMSHTLISA